MAADPVRKLPPRTVRFEFAGDYAGYFCTVLMNVPRHVRDGLFEDARVAVCFDTIVQAHNFTDFDGVAYPDPDPATGALYQALPADISIAVIRNFNVQLGQLPPLTAVKL
jgi:hypothetical protein